MIFYIVKGPKVSYAFLRVNNKFSHSRQIFPAWPCSAQALFIVSVETLFVAEF